MWKSIRQTALIWLTASLLAFVFSTHTACGPEKTQEQVDEPAKEKAEEKAEESTEEKAEEETKEQVDEPAEETTTPDEPTSKEETVVDEPAPVDESQNPDANEEMAPDDTPEEPVQETEPETTPETPTEPSGPDPTVTITAPKDGDVVKDSIQIKADVTVTGASIARVELHVDGKKVDETTNTPYDFVFDTKAVKDGVHKIKVIGFTDLKKQASDEISLTFANFGPTITFVKPKEGSAVQGKMDIEVTVTDPLGLKANSVTLNVDGVPVPWTSSTPSYKASVDVSKKPYDSIPIQVSAENTKGIKKQTFIWVVHLPPAGPKKLGEECDNNDAKKRCIADHACVNIGAAGAKNQCYKTCAVGGGTAQCPVSFGKRVQCVPTWQGTKRGTCQAWDAAPGSLFSVCGGSQTCNSGLVCVGIRGGKSYCLTTCKGANDTCKTQGFFCAPLSSGGGACIEKCQQTCKTDTECTKGQKCTNGVCGAPYCGNYGTCQSLSGLSHKICI